MHADADAFGPVVVSISLATDWPMRFRPRYGQAYSRNGLDTLPGSQEDLQPVTNLDPDAVTLPGDPKERQAALKKLGEQLYPTLSERIAGPNISST